MLVISKILSVFAPHTCNGCGLEGSLLCNWCYPDSFNALPSRCYRCQTKTIQSATCAKCRRQSSLQNVWIGAEYKGAAEILVKQLKFARTQDAGKVLARRLDEAVPFLKDAVITFAPTATTRRRQRGYDQAQVVAKEFARLRELPCPTLLGRLGQQRQVGASREERLQQLNEAFWVPKQHKVKGRHVVLVDDVMTTGATLEAASKALKNAGAKRVSAVVCAYQPKKQ